MRRPCAGGVIALLWCATAVSGCLTSTLLITVRPDGSAHIEQTTLVRPAAVAEFEKLANQSPADRTTSEKLWAEIQKRARSTRVYEVPLTPVNNGDAIGVSSSYDVPDITNVYDLDLVPGVPGLGRVWSVATPDTGARTTLRMTLEPIADGLERLTVHFPRFRVDPATEPPSAWASGSAAEMQALKEIFSGARVTIAIATDSPLVRTNSPYREGNRVTLADVDLAEALFSREVQRMAATPGTFDELLSWLATVPGVTLAPGHDVILEFQNPSTRPGPALPAGAPPASMDTDVFLAALVGTGSTLAVGPPVNISNSPGYDNQPFFSPDGARVFFASSRAGAAAARDVVGAQQSALPKTDIYRYDISSRNLFRITQTAESEFSPTVMPDGTHLSMIRVEADGTQHLCSVEPANVPRRETSVMLPNVKPVGYHAWIDAKTVALYVLGESGQPATLQIVSLEGGPARTVATNIGRSLQRMPSGAISFVQRERGTGNTVTAVLQELDVRSLESRPLVKFPAGMTDPYVAWMPDGTALTAYGSTLYRWHAGDPDWTAFAHLDGFGLQDVTRLAVSPHGDRLALVARK